MKSIRTRSVFLFVLQLCFWMGSGCDRFGATVDDRSAVVTVKQPGGLTDIIVAAIQEPVGGRGTLTAISEDKEIRLSPGDVLNPSTILVPPSMEAVLRFGEKTSVRISENSRVRVGHDPHLELMHGEIAISRKPGAPSSFEVRLLDSRWSIRNGRILLQRNDQEGLATVISGEMENLKTGTIMGSGDTVAAGTAASIESDAPPPPLTLRVPWDEPLSPVPPAAPLNPDAPTFQRGIGTLEARDPRSGKRNQDALEITEQKVHITIQEGVALTAIETAFLNRSNVTVEAAFRFLLPSMASITRLALDVNGRIEEGEVLERKQAARIFKSIVDDSVRPRDPALLEWEEGSSFRMKIFPVAGGETRRVYLTYMTPMTASGSDYRYVYPLGARTGVPQIGQFDITADIRSTGLIEDIRTPLYPSTIEVERARATVSMRAQQIAPSRDFVISWRQRTDTPVRMTTQTEPDGQTFTMALLRPEGITAQRFSQRIVAIMDTSFGMSKELRELSAEMLLELLGGLGHRDQFQVLACDSGCRPLLADFASADAETLLKLRKTLDSIPSGGATHLLGAFASAFSLLRGDAPATVIYMGDGIATSGERDPGRLIRILQEIRPVAVRVHTVGIGPDVDAPALQRLASGLGGDNYNLSVGESPASASWHLSRWLDPNALLDVTLRMETPDHPALRFTSYPERIGFIPAGREVGLVSRIEGRIPDGGTDAVVHLSGTDTRGAEITRQYRVRLVLPPAPAAGFVSRLWARDHIDALQFGDGSVRDIVRTSRAFRVASRHTSWIVLENQRMYDQFGIERTDPRTYDGTPSYFATGSEEVDAEMASEPTAAPLDSAVQTTAPKARSQVALGPRAASTAPSRSQAPMSADADMSIAKEAINEGAVVPVREEELQRRRPPVRCPPPRTIRSADIRAATPAGDTMRRRATELMLVRDQQSLSRTAHRRLVRHLAKMTDRQAALTAATRWLEQDPLSVDALLSLSAELQRAGDRDHAMRTMASVAEIRADDAASHERLAAAFRSVGDYMASAGHYRALADLRSRNREDALQHYLFSLAMAGLRDLLRLEARTVLADRSLRKIHAAVTSLLAGLETGILPDWTPPRGGGALTVRLQGMTADLDILVVDPYGRVFSGIWPAGAVVTSLRETETERLSIGVTIPGSYQIRVIRPVDGENTQEIIGRMTVTYRDQTRTFPVKVTDADTHIATMTLREVQRPLPCY